jgi:hypothetical protein
VELLSHKLLVLPLSLGVIHMHISKITLTAFRRMFLCGCALATTRLRAGPIDAEADLDWEQCLEREGAGELDDSYAGAC